MRTDIQTEPDGEAENWSRMKGLLAVLALPALLCADGRHRKPPVEVEVEPMRWVPIENLVIDSEGMTFIWGRNGSSVVYRVEGTKCPRWRLTWTKSRSA